MFASAFVAVSSSTAAAFAPKSRIVHAATRAYSRSTVAMMAHPKGELSRKIFVPTLVGFYTDLL
jgi:hypothetical protein